MIAIVPSYEEPPEILAGCVRSLVAQSIVIDEIHVVDDGSIKHPVVPWSHPRVFWHRQPNGGKRSAQHRILTLLAEREDPVDFLLTVDSDSRLAEDAAAHLLRAMSDPRITAASGAVYASNRRENLLTRVLDVNVGSITAIGRVSRSLLGTLETTSGSLAIYRASIPLRRREHYLASGTYADDRMLALYAELEGRVVSVNEAVCYSEAPTTVRDTYRQRLRWAKGKWRTLGFTLTNMPPRHLIFPVLTLLQTVALPVLYAALITALVKAPSDARPGACATVAAVWLSIAYARVGLYLLRRVDLALRSRVLTWLFITPLELVLSLCLMPVHFVALAKVGDRSWGTRPTAPTAYPPDPAAPRA